MKKTLALILSLVLILSLSACAKEPTAQELYTLVSEKNVSIDKMDASITMNGTVGIGVAGISQDLTLSMNGSVLGENIGKEGMRMSMPVDVGIAGTTIKTNMYFADGWYLMEMAGQKVKCPMDIEKAMDQFTNVEIQPLDYVELGEMTKDSSTKLYTIPYTMDMEKAVEMSLGALDMTGIDPAQMENIEWTGSSGKLVADKNGNLKSQETTIGFSSSMEGIEMTCDMIITVVYNDIGENFKVDIPDATNYVEVAPAEIGL